MPLRVGADVLVRKLDYVSGQPTMSGRAPLSSLRQRGGSPGAISASRGSTHCGRRACPSFAGDLFTEYYVLGRHYNVFHIADERGCAKGWYCNVTRPPDLDEEGVSFVDLALDLFAHPDGRYTVLDEDEFAAASDGIYLPEDIAGARKGLEELVALSRERRLPSPRNDA